MKSFSELPDHLLKQFQDGADLRGQGYRGRFAPSPTGSLHLGNIRTALVSWLRARLSSGIWLLRVDDLDTPRNRSGAVESLKKDLLWLGLNWNGPIIFQSQRTGIYSSVLSALRRQGKLYPCWCSRRMLANLSNPEGRLQIYPGHCRNLGLSWGWQNERLPSWRLRVDPEFSITCGDVILRRADGFISYHLATVVDELMLGVSEVVRGEDLEIALTPQLALVNSLEQKPLKYVHVPLLYDPEGRKLSKRDGSQGLDSLRYKGMTSSQVIGYLASSLDLVPKGSEMNTNELLSDLLNRENAINTVVNASLENC